MAKSKKKKAVAKPVKKKAKKKAGVKKAGRSIRNVTPVLLTTGATAESIVPVTYVLTKSNDVVLKRMYIGDTKIDLEVDQDPNDPNRFLTRGSKKYMCINENEGLKVFITADGNAGGFWSLEISRSGSALSSNPIRETTDNNGCLNHNEYHD